LRVEGWRRYWELLTLAPALSRGERGVLSPPGGREGYCLSPEGRGAGGEGLGGDAGIDQARFALQQGDADFFGAAGVDGGFVDDHIAGFEQAADGLAGAFERGQVRPFVAVDRGGNGDDADPDVTFLMVVRRCSRSPGLMRSGE